MDFPKRKMTQNQAPEGLFQNPFGQNVEKNMLHNLVMVPMASSRQIGVNYRFPVFGNFEILTKIMRYPIETDRNINIKN